MNDLRRRATELITTIDQNLKKWQSWFPNERSTVEVPRCDLLALKHFAEIALKDHPPEKHCEHGIIEGEWCEPCNKEYKRAAKAYEEHL